MAILILCLGDVEHREHRGSDDEKCRLYQVTPRTDALTGAKCQSDCRVVLECSILVEESLGLECVWIRIEIWVMKNRPRKFLSENYEARWFLVRTICW